MTKPIVEILKSLNNATHQSPGEACRLVLEAITDLQPYREIQVGIINSGGVTDQVRSSVPVKVLFVDLDNLDEDYEATVEECEADYKEILALPQVVF